jgi:hypothetical protein
MKDTQGEQPAQEAQAPPIRIEPWTSAETLLLTEINNTLKVIAAILQSQVNTRPN